MTNIEKFNKAFIDTFNVEEEKVASLTYQSIKSWDSIGHMNLIAALEETFDIMMETDDIIGFSSYEKGMEILKTNYNIEM